MKDKMQAKIILFLILWVAKEPFFDQCHFLYTHFSCKINTIVTKPICVVFCIDNVYFHELHSFISPFLSSLRVPQCISSSAWLPCWWCWRLSVSCSSWSSWGRCFIWRRRSPRTVWPSWNMTIWPLAPCQTVPSTRPRRTKPNPLLTSPF